MDWLKCNTVGASKGNLNPSATIFCIRNYIRDLIVEKGVRMEDTTSLVAEARAIKECLMFCQAQRLNNLIIELDSWSLVHILERN